MNSRNLILGGGVAVAVVAAGGWFFLGGSGGGSGAQAGVGAYNQEMSTCQDRVMEHEMHLTELEFTPNTSWHQQAGADLKLGGKLTKPGAKGSKTPFNYECTVRAGRVVAVAVQ